MSAAAKSDGANLLQVQIESSAPRTADGILVFAKLDVPVLGLHNVFLYLNPVLGEIGLQAPCGCRTGLPLSRLLADLQETVAEAHPDQQCLSQQIH